MTSLQFIRLPGKLLGKRASRAARSRPGPNRIWSGILAGLLIFGSLFRQSVEAGETERDTGLAVELSPESAKFVEIGPVGPRKDPAWSRPVAGRVSIPAPARIAVGAIVDGLVQEIFVRPGDRVEAGQRLLKIQSTGGGQSRADAELAGARLAAAQENLKRFNAMAERGVGTEVERLEAEVRLREAKIEADRTKKVLALVGEGNGLQMFVVAPTNGFVLTVQPGVGSVMKVGDEVVEIGDPSRVWIESEVNEDEAAEITCGQHARIESLRGGRLSEASVALLTAQIDPATRRRRIYLAPFRDALEWLTPGLPVEVRFAESPQEIVIPAEAVLIKSGNRRIVYVQESDGKLHAREVIVGNVSSGWVRVFKGLKEGERVVVKGALLVDGRSEQLL